MPQMRQYTAIFKAEARATALWPFGTVTAGYGSQEGQFMQAPGSSGNKSEK